MDLQPQLRLVYAGEVLDGFARDEVKRRFGEMFKLEGDRLSAVFSGKPMVLKRGLPKDDAEKYVERLVRLGMRVRVEPQDAPAPAPSPAPSPATPRAPIAAALPTPAAAAAPSLIPLEEEVECPNCGERQPKRFVLCRQCTTDIPRALASRAEDAERARAERQAAREAAAGGGRYAPPGAAVGEVYASGELVDPPPMLSLSFEGRMGRASYVNSFGVCMVGVALVGIVAAVLIPMTQSALLFIPMALFMIPAFVWMFRISALRLHDLNRSGWWVLTSLVPYVGWILNVVLLLVPGNAEENDYGPKPRRGNMVVASIIAVLLVVSMISVGVVSNRAYNKYSERARDAQARAEAREDDEQQSANGAPQNAEGKLLANDPRVAQRVPADLVGIFREQYASAADNKAFAVSGKTAYGLSVNRNSPRDAITAALAACEERREPYTAACRVVNVNGSWSRTPD